MIWDDVMSASLGEGAEVLAVLARKEEARQKSLRRLLVRRWWIAMAISFAMIGVYLTCLCMQIQKEDYWHHVLAYIVYFNIGAALYRSHLQIVRDRP